MKSPDAVDLSASQAYEAAYRFVWQYAERESSSEALQLLLVAMEPSADGCHSNDPASWSDWLACVDATRTGAELPRP